MRPVFKKRILERLIDQRVALQTAGDWERLDYLEVSPSEWEEIHQEFYIDYTSYYGKGDLHLLGMRIVKER